jgi:hypothetical protein
MAGNSGEDIGGVRPADNCVARCETELANSTNFYTAGFAPPVSPEHFRAACEEVCSAGESPDRFFATTGSQTSS